MFLRRLKSKKGLAITLSFILGGLFAIGIMGLLYWLFLSRILEMHVAIDEATNERHAINLANVLISSEKIAYEKDGKVNRGILDAEKLDSVFVKKTDFTSNTFIQPKDIGIGYPNSLSVVRIIDVEECDSSNNCEGWIVFLSGPVSIQGLSITKFVSCLAEHLQPLDIGSLFRFFSGGPIMALWQPYDLKNCVQNTMPSSISSFFSRSQISSDGFPVLIKYPTGELHIGRMSVAVGEFV